MTFAEALRSVDTQFEVISPLEMAECERRLKAATVSMWHPMAEGIAGWIRPTSIRLARRPVFGEVQHPFKPLLFGEMGAHASGTLNKVRIGMHPIMPVMFGFSTALFFVFIVAYVLKGLSSSWDIGNGAFFFLVFLAFPLLLWWGRNESRSEHEVLEQFLLATIDGTKRASAQEPPKDRAGL